MDGLKLTDRPVHLGRGAIAQVQPSFTGDSGWCEAYASRTMTDGADGRLITLHRFTESWTSWEMHPAGPEVVVCTAGAMTIIQERPDGGLDPVTPGTGD